jgi:hypothetical protein
MSAGARPQSRSRPLTEQRSFVRSAWKHVDFGAHGAQQLHVDAA